MKDLFANTDAIWRSVWETSFYQAGLTWEVVISMLISLTAALLMGFLIYYIYRKSYRGVVYSQTYAMTLVAMCVLTCSVVQAITTNVLSSLGMIGALSIIRYRTAVKEPFDLMFLFWAITSGIALGARMYALTAMSSVFLILLIFILSGKGKDGSIYIMIVRYEGNDITDEIRRILRGRQFVIKSKTARREIVEMAIEINVRNDNFSFSEQISALENVKDLTMVQYNGEYHG